MNWLDFLAEHGARLEAGQVKDFGNSEAELQAAGSSTVVAPMTHFSIIRASGDDAATFLHNLMSNDVLHLGRNRAERCGFCSPKGRLLADFLLWRDEHDYILQLSADIQQAMLKKLGMYVLRSKVKLSDANKDLILLGLAGSEAPAAIKSLGAEIPAAEFDVSHYADGTVIRLDGGRFQIALRAENAARVWSQLVAVKVTPVGTQAWRWLEIAAGVPHITAPTQEEFVPQMANFELIGGVSFTKGCYPGQEVVARTKYLGKVKRRTYRARVEAGCPAAGTDLFSIDLPDQSCGKVVESAPSPAGGCEVLASMLMSSAATGEVRVGAPDGPKLSLLSLPYPLD